MKYSVCVDGILQQMLSKDGRNMLEYPKLVDAGSRKHWLKSPSALNWGDGGVCCLNDNAMRCWDVLWSFVSVASSRPRELRCLVSRSRFAEVPIGPSIQDWTEDRVITASVSASRLDGNFPCQHGNARVHRESYREDSCKPSGRHDTCCAAQPK
jgi:hypothetical protein